MAASDESVAVQTMRFLASLDLNAKTDVALRDYKGRVVMVFQKPMDHVIFDPQAAWLVAENLARCAHKAKFPEEKIPDDFSYLANQIKQRLTEDMRDRLAVRIAAMLPSLLERKGDISYISFQIIDTIFSALDAESYTKLDPKGGVKYDA